MTAPNPQPAPDLPDAPDLNALQRDLGMTREALALAMGVHRQTLAKWQRGEQRAPAAACRLALALHWLHRHRLLAAFLRDQPG